MKITKLLEASSAREVDFPIHMGITVAGFNRDSALEEFNDEDNEDNEDDDNSRFTDPLHIPAGEYTFTYDYPLENEVEFKHRLTEATSILDILELAAKDYQQIYDEEDESESADPTPDGALLNRGESHGKHGIWGHGIEDLVFEGVYVKNFAVTFDIGS